MDFDLPTAFAIALGNLYHDDLDVDLSDVAGVLAAAAALGFKQLMEGYVHTILMTRENGNVRELKGYF